MLINSSFGDGYPHIYRCSEMNFFDDINVIEVGYNRVPKNKRQIMQRDVYIIHYITRGKCTFLGATLTAGQGYVVVPEELEIISADCGADYESYWIMFRGAMASEIIKKCGLSIHNGGFSFSNSLNCAEIIKNTIFADYNDNFEENLKMQAAFYEITALHRAENKTDETLTTIALDVKKFIKGNYHRQIKIGEIAELFGVTRNYLFTLFKNEYDLSPQEYLLDTRIKKAKILLKDETQQLSVGEIAFAVGFNDPLYFSRIFHKKVGQTPKEFRLS